MSVSTLGKITDTVTVTVHMNDIRNVQITNADRIRNMTDEELAHYIGHLVRQGRRQAMFDYECGLNWLRDEYDRFFFDEWLKQEAER